MQGRGGRVSGLDQKQGATRRRATDTSERLLKTPAERSSPLLSLPDLKL
jgi:hypothetical protein